MSSDDAVAQWRQLASVVGPEPAVAASVGVPPEPLEPVLVEVAPSVRLPRECIAPADRFAPATRRSGVHVHHTIGVVGVVAAIVVAVGVCLRKV